MSYKIKDKDGKLVHVKDQQAFGFDMFEAEVKDFSNAERSLLAVANAESVDRYEDIIMVDGWDLKNYKKNPVIMAFHDYRSLPVGRALETFRDEKRKIKRLMQSIQFAAYPDTIRLFEMYRDKYIKGFSVGFIAMKEEPIKEDEEKKFMFFHEPTRYLEQELLETSSVPIPAHPDALSEIRAMVKREFLYIPARYLRKEEDPEVETIGDRVHVTVSDEDEFETLYVREFENVVVVFGKMKEHGNELFPCKYIMHSDYCCPEVALEWTEEMSSEIFDSIVEEQKGGDPPALRLYDPEKYESEDVVLVDTIPSSDSLQFDAAAPDGDDDDDEDDWSIAEIDEMDIEFEEDEYIEKEDITKPYPNEHACRLKDPGKYSKFARKNCFRKSDGKCIDFIFGIADGKSETQALRYKKDVWSAAAAKSHCGKKGGTFEAAGKGVEIIAVASAGGLHFREGEVTERFAALETNVSEILEILSNDDEASRERTLIYRTDDIIDEAGLERIKASLAEHLKEYEGRIVILDGGASISEVPVVSEFIEQFEALQLAIDGLRELLVNGRGEIIIDEDEEDLDEPGVQASGDDDEIEIEDIPTDDDEIIEVEEEEVDAGDEDVEVEITGYDKESFMETVRDAVKGSLGKLS